MFSKCVQRLIRDGYYNAKLRKILIFILKRRRNFIFYNVFVLQKTSNVWLKQHRNGSNIAI